MKIKKVLEFQINSFQLNFINLLQMANPIGKKRNRYRKLPLKTKVIFLKRVLEEGHSIKKVSASFKINYSTAKTLIRNEKLKKGKMQLSQLNLESNSIEKEPAETGEQMGIICTYRSLEQTRSEGLQTNFEVAPKKIEIISRISFSLSPIL